MENKRKKVFLSYVYSSKNAGDLAICLGAVDLLLESGYSVTLLSKYDRNDPEFFSSREYYKKRYGNRIQFLEAPFTLDRAAGKMRKLFNNIKGLCVYLGLGTDRTHEIEASIRTADYIVFNGGNLLRCESFLDYARLMALYYPIKIGKRYHKPYLIFPQSSAEIKGKGRKFLFKLISEAEVVFIREQRSYNDLLKKFSFNNLIPTIDLAYFIDKKSVGRSSSDSKTIAITLRSHTIGDIQEFDEIERIKIYNTLKSVFCLPSFNDYNVVFVVQTKKDLEFSMVVSQRLTKDFPAIEVSVFENYDPIELLTFYKSVNLLIGMRLHSIILASSIGVPCYGLFYSEWGLKNPGLMEHLNMPFSMVDKNEGIREDEISRLLSQYGTLSKRLEQKVDIEKNKVLTILDEKINS